MTTFAVRLTPRAGTDRVDTVVAGVLRCRVAAAPVAGAANAALVRLLAAELGIPRSAVRVVGGAKARTKLVEVEGVGTSTLVARWPGLAV